MRRCVFAAIMLQVTVVITNDEFSFIVGKIIVALAMLILFGTFVLALIANPDAF